MSYARIDLLLVLAGFLVGATPGTLGASEAPSQRPDEQKQKNVRRPNNDEELAYWLRNMIWHHRFTTDEVCTATGLSEQEIKALYQGSGR